MASNRSQIYIDTIDNSSQVIGNIANQIHILQGHLQGMGNASQNGFNQANNHLRNQTTLLSQINNQFSGLGGTIAGTVVRMASVTAAILAIKKVGEEVIDLFKQGVQINIETETTKIGIAGLVSTLYEFQDGTQKLQGMDKFNTSLVVTEQIMKRLKISAIETGASFDEVVEGYRNAVGGGAKLGIDPVRLEKLSTLVANSAKGFGLAKGQTGQETRALFSGKIDKSATIGTNLGFGAGGAYQKQYQEALKKGGDDFAKFLEERLAQFELAGKKYAQTVGGIFDQMGDAFKLYKGDIASGLSEELVKIGPIVNSLFSKGDFTEKLDGMTATLKTIGKLVGENIVGGFQAVVDVIFSVSEYLSEDQTIINGIIESAGMLWDTFGMIFDIVGEVFGVFGDIFFSLGQIFGLTSETGQELSGIQMTVKIITGFFAGLNVIIAAIKDTVKLVADGIRLMLGGAIKWVMGNLSEFIGAAGRLAKTLKMDGVSNALLDVSEKLKANTEKAAETVIGAKNSFGDVLLGTKGIGDIYEDTGKKALEMAKKIEDGNKKQNGTFKNFIDKMRKDRADVGKPDPRTKNLTFSSNASGDDEEGSGKGGGKKQYDPNKELIKGYEKELDAFRKGNDFKRKENELLYSNFKKTMQQYYNDKNALDDADYNKMVDTYNKEKKIVEDRLNAINGKKGYEKESETLKVKMLEITNKITNAEKEHKLAVMETTFAIENQTRKLKDQLDDFNSNINDLLGNRRDGAKLKLDVEIRNLKYENQNNPEMLKQIDFYEEIRKYQIEQQSTLELLGLTEANLMQQKEMGSLVQIDFYKQLGDLNKERLKQYEDELALILKIAKAKNLNVDDNARVKELQNLINQTKGQLNPLSADIKKTFEQSFGTFFNDVISGTKSIKDAFRDMVGSITQYITKFASEKLLQQMLGGLSNMGGGGGDFFGSIANFLGSMLGGGRATGGSVDAGMLYRFNEGPGKGEIFAPKTGGYVLNDARSSDLINGLKNRKSVNNIYMNVQSKDRTSFVNSETQMATMLASVMSRANKNG